MTRSLFASVLLLVSFSTASPAFAASKDMIQLQTQIQQLQDAVARLQQSNDERMGVLKDLVQQSADSVNKLSTNMDALQRQVQTQTEAQGGKVDQVSGQVQALNDSLDELKARMSRMEKLLQTIQSQQQTIGAGAAAAAAPTTAPTADTPANTEAPTTAPTTAPAPVRDTTAAPPTGRRGKPSAALPAMPDTAASVTAAAPADEMYKTALGDYMSAKYALASSEFGDVVRTHPDSPLAGNAVYYQGEIDYRAGRYGAAAKNYDKVLEQYPDSNKVPAAHLHKAQALLQLKQTDAGVRELRALVQRFPNSPEAVQARSKLNGLGVPIRPRG